MYMGNILTGLVDKHNEAYHYWQILKYATILRIDSHPDMSDNIRKRRLFELDYYKALVIQILLQQLSITRMLHRYTR